MAQPILTITVNKREITNLTNWVNKAERTFISTDVMDVGVKYIGRSIDRNFKLEGMESLGGKWRGLSAMTNKVRRERGYPEAHPILVQSGALRETVAGTLSSWTIGTKRATVNADGIRMAAWTGLGKFTANISGKKVANQFGGKTIATYYPEGTSRGGSTSDLPARPFFGLTQASVLEARDAMIDKMLLDWSRQSGTSKRV